MQSGTTMYERKPKGLQAIASAIASLRADFRAKDDARAAAMQELSQSVATSPDKGIGGCLSTTREQAHC